MRGLARDTRGVIYAEFLIAFTPIFLFFLALVQMALIYSTHLVVQHAAVTAARAAAVVLDDDPRFYGGARRNVLSDEGSCGVDPLGAFQELIGEAGDLGASCRGGARLHAIRAAAAIPLLAVSSSMEQLVGSDSVYAAIRTGRGPASGKALYNRAAVAVTFPEAPGASHFRTSFAPDARLTVRVTFAYQCVVPLANRLICSSVRELETGVPWDALQDLARTGPNASPGEIAAKVRRVEEAAARLARVGTTLHELDHAEEPWLLGLGALTGARFAIVRAEATLPNQGALYPYPDELAGGGP